MKKLIYFLVFIVSGALTSCIEPMDIPPKSILGSDNVYTEVGMKAYFAGMYNRFPMDDFNVTGMDRGKGEDTGVEGYFGWNSQSWGMMTTGETVNGNNYRDQPIYIVQTGYWTAGYQLIRAANDLIQELPAYFGKLQNAENYFAEAHFIRAYVYFQLVKRYGGVPLIDKPQYLEAGNEAALWVARSSHEDCYDFILNDLDYAIQNMTEAKKNGMANKYVAAAFKSRVALYAGSIAKYGGAYEHSRGGVRLCGIPAEKANGYYQQAWEAAKFVEEFGGYDLYTDGTDMSFANVFVNADNSPESIFIRQYSQNSYDHSFDGLYSPGRMTVYSGNRYSVTLDWIELFDELPLDPATGRLKTVDNNNNYIVYDNPQQLFENVKDSRLRGSIILPGSVFRGVQLDIRRGILKEDAYDPDDASGQTIQKFTPDDGSNITPYPFGETGNIMTTTANYDAQTPYQRLPDGLLINIGGMDGPVGTSGRAGTYTGFHGRKWLNANMTLAEAGVHKSTQSWIDIRYAEVLLNRAEAALELHHNGVLNINGATTLSDAAECVNRIRTRAGIDPIASSELASTGFAHDKGGGIGGFVWAPNRGLQLLRIERYKELAFEHKLYWDLRRWFSFHRQINNYYRRMLNPFLFAKGATVNAYGNPEGKYIYDARTCEFLTGSGASWTFDVRYYYERIPDAQLKTNPKLEQNNYY